MREFYITNIKLNTDREKIKIPPIETTIKTENEDEIADKLSDEHGLWILHL